MSRATTIEDVGKAVHELADAVVQMKQGMVDRQTVVSLAEEVVARSSGVQRRGFQIEDLYADELHAVGGLDDPEIAGNAFERLGLMHSLPADAVARVTGRSEELVREFQQAGDRLVLLSAYQRAYASSPSTFDPRRLDYYSRYRRVVQALDSTTAAEGDEFVPTELSASLIERVNLKLRIAALFPFVQMPSNPFEIPGFSLTRKHSGKLVEATADTGQAVAKKVTPGSRKVTLTAVKLAVEALVSKELEEDGIIAILPFMEEELVDYLAADIEDAIVNGDTAGTHQDADVTDADDPRKIWEGLRQLTLAGAKTDQSAAAKLTSAMLMTNRQKMGKYGVVPGDLAHLISINGYLQLLEDDKVQTIDKYGPQATILTGELGKSHGVPLIVSEYVRTDLDALGVNGATGANNIKQIALTVNVRGFLHGERRGITVQVLRELYAESDQDAILVTARKAFEPRWPAATEKAVAYSFNIAS